MDSNKKVWMMQLVKYFLFSKDYLQVSIVVPDKSSDDLWKDQVWLVNRNDVSYPIIHISNSSDQIRHSQIEVTEETIKKIRELLKNEKGQLLDISVSDESSCYSENNIEYISIHPDCLIDEKILKDFPEVNKVVYSVENPDKELEKLNKDIAKSYYQKQKNIRKKINNEIYKNNLCKTFIVPAVICVIYWLAILIVRSAFDTSSTTAVITLGGYYKAFITVLNQYWRLFTSGFMHVGLLHLLCNLMALFSMAKDCENIYGTNGALIILCLSIVSGNLFLFALGKNVVSLGISGGIYGLFGALTVAYLQKGFFKSPIFRNKYIKNLYINILINLLPNVSFLAHIGGFVCGAIMGVLMSKVKKYKNLKVHVAICSVVLACALGFLSYKNADFVDYYLGEDIAVCEVYKKVGLSKLAYNSYDKLVDYYMGN